MRYDWSEPQAFQQYRYESTSAVVTAPLRYYPYWRRLGAALRLVNPLNTVTWKPLIE